MGDALPEWIPERADALFVAGVDWRSLEKRGVIGTDKPIINFIQHVRHADKNDIRYPFLKNRAIRICVSEQVTEAITESGQANGPVFTIPNGIDFSLLPASNKERPISLLIAALKQPELGKEISDHLISLGYNVTLLTKSIPRNEYLDILATSKICLFLPTKTEGFYLPALEAMALGTLVVCPDCVGNRGFCKPNYNCIIPEYNTSALVNAVKMALSLTTDESSQYINNADHTVQNYNIEMERKTYLGILERLPQIW